MAYKQFFLFCAPRREMKFVSPRPFTCIVDCFQLRAIWCMYNFLFFIRSTAAWTTCKSQSKNNLLSNFCVCVYGFFTLSLPIFCCCCYCWCCVAGAIVLLLPFENFVTIFFRYIVCMFCQYQLYQHQYYIYFIKTKIKHVYTFVCLRSCWWRAASIRLGKKCMKAILNNIEGKMGKLN